MSNLLMFIFGICAIVLMVGCSLAILIIVFKYVKTIWEE